MIIYKHIAAHSDTYAELIELNAKRPIQRNCERGMDYFLKELITVWKQAKAKEQTNNQTSA